FAWAGRADKCRPLRFHMLRAIRGDRRRQERQRIQACHGGREFRVLGEDLLLIDGPAGLQTLRIGFQKRKRFLLGMRTAGLRLGWHGLSQSTESLSWSG